MSDNHNKDWIGDNISAHCPESYLRVATWNIRGALLAGADIEGQSTKLTRILQWSERYDIDFITIQEPGCQLGALRRALPPSYRAFGKEQGLLLVVWIVKRPWTATVQVQGDDTNGRIVVLRLAGKLASHQTLVGYWGVPGSVHSSAALAEHEVYLRAIESIIDNTIRRDRATIWAGDMNLVLRTGDAKDPLSSSIKRFRSTADSLGLVSGFIERSEIRKWDSRLTNGAYTFHRDGESRSLIDHILADPRDIMECGIGGSAPVISDHRPVVCTIKAKVAKPASQRLDRITHERCVFQHWTNYRIADMRLIDQDGLDDFEQELEAASRVDSAVQDSAAIDQLWERCEGHLKELEKECPKVKPLRQRQGRYHDDRESKRIGKMNDRWKRTIVLVKERMAEGGAGMSTNYIQTVVTSSMWGGKDRQRRAKEFWESLQDEVCSWAKLQLPCSENYWLRGQCDSSANKKKDKGARYQRRARLEWKSWVCQVHEAQEQLQKIWKKRASKWRRWRHKAHLHSLRDEFAEGRIGHLFRKIFPKAAQGETEATLQGDNWITGDAEVADLVAIHFRDIAAPSSWNRPFDMMDPTSQDFLEGPWKGQPRISRALLRHINSNRCNKPEIQRALQKALDPISLEDLLQEASSSASDSSPGISGLSYGIFVGLPLRWQKILLHFRNLFVTRQHIPKSLCDLVMIVIPKVNSPVVGYGAVRPISLYEVLLKLSTGTVQPVVDRCMEEVMHPNQFVGRKHISVQQALQLVLHSMELLLRRGQKIVIQACDVADAFPTVHHWLLEMVLKGYGFPQSLVQFMKIADAEGEFCMRTKRAFSKWFRKPWGGIGQGEKSSPGKYVWSTDPVLWRLHEDGVRELGIWVGYDFPEEIEVGGEKMRFVVVDGYLVATMFMDDLFLMSGSEEDMQMLNFIVTEFHDFQGSAMAAHKCVGGSSVPRERCFVDFENGGWTTARLFDEIREWCTLRGNTLSNRGVDQPRYEFRDGGVRVWVSQKELELLGDPVDRLCGDVWVRGQLPITQDQLLSKLHREGWTGSVMVSHRPLFILNVKTGARQYIKWIQPHEALKLLGVFISPTVNWDKSISEINKKMHKLLGAFEGATRRREWRIIDLIRAAVGKIGGTARFPSGLVPIPTSYATNWDDRLVRAHGRAMRVPLGTSHDMLRDNSALGSEVLSLRRVVASSFMQGMYSSLQGDSWGSRVARQNLREFQQAKRFKVCPLAVPLHPAEQRSKVSADLRFEIMREHLLYFKAAVDGKEQKQTHQTAPWQTFIPLEPAGAIQAKELKRLMQPLLHMSTGRADILLRHAYEGRLVGELRNHIPQKLSTALKKWIGVSEWPSWDPFAIIPICSFETMQRDPSFDPPEQIFMSDATFQSTADSTVTGIACLQSGSSEVRVGRCHLHDSRAYEGEVCGVLENELCSRDVDTGVVASDCASALWAIQRSNDQPALPWTSLSLERMAPLWIWMEWVKEFLKRRLPKQWVRAHTTKSAITSGSLTYIQDECDKWADHSLELEEIQGDFFELDLHFGLFDTSEGYRPGQRVRVLEAMSVWLNRRQVPIDESRPTERLDGSFSWRALRQYDWYKIRSLTPRWDQPPRWSPPLQLNQRFEWDGSTLLECKSKKTKRGQLYLAANRLKVSVGGGRIPFGSSLLDSDKLKAGLGDCSYCDQCCPRLNVQHLFLCNGSRVNGMGDMHTRLKSRRLHRYLAMLARFELQGFSYPIAPGHGQGEDQLESNMGVEAQDMSIVEFYNRPAEEQSEELSYNLSMRQYRQDMRKWRYRKALREKMENDKSFCVPAYLRKRVNQQLEDQPVAPMKPATSMIGPKRSPIDVSQRQQRWKWYDPFFIRSIRVKVLSWISAEAEQVSGRALAEALEGKGVYEGALPDQLIQEALIRWIGKSSSDQVVALTQSWRQVLSITIQHRGLIFGKWNSWSIIEWPTKSATWVTMVLTSKAEVLNLLAWLPCDDAKGVALITDKAWDAHIKLPAGWTCSSVFELALYPLRQKKQIRGQHIKQKMRLLGWQIDELPLWLSRWSQHHHEILAPVTPQTDASKDWWASLQLDACEVEGWSNWWVNSWSFDNKGEARLQGQLAGLILQTDIRAWRQWEVGSQVELIAIEHLLAQTEWYNGLLAVRRACDEMASHALNLAELCGFSAALPASVIHRGIGRRLGKRIRKNKMSTAFGWQGVGIQALGLRDEVLRTGAVVTRQPKQTAHALPRRDYMVGRLLSFKSMLRTSEQSWLDELCSCGQPYPWDVQGDRSALPSATEEGLCRICREKGSCTQMAMARGEGCLHCDNCGSGVHTFRLYFVPSCPVVCKGCAGWYYDRWPYSRMWSPHSRKIYLWRMISRCCDWWSSNIPSSIVSRISTGLLRQWPDSVPELLRRPFEWGRIWMTVGAILQALGFEMKSTTGPDRCDAWRQTVNQTVDLEDWTHELDHDWWQHHCFAFQDEINSKTSKHAWRQQKLSPGWVKIKARTYKMESHLEMYIVAREMLQCEGSTLSSPGGNSVGPNDSKRCQHKECQYDVREDAYDEHSLPGARHLFLCDGCNRGFHADCATSLGWERPTVDTDEEQTTWHCGDCKDKGLISTIVDVGVNKARQIRWLVRWVRDSADSILTDDALRDSPGAEQLLKQYRERLRNRRASGLDLHPQLINDAKKGHQRDWLRIDTCHFDVSATVFKSRRLNTFEQHSTHALWRALPLNHRRPIFIVGRDPWRDCSPLNSREALLQRWRSYQKYCKLTVTYEWFSVSHGRKTKKSEPSSYGPGSRADNFLEAVAHELNWMPNGALVDEWPHLFREHFSSLEKPSQEIVLDDWNHLVAACNWVRDRHAVMENKLHAISNGLLNGRHNFCFIGDRHRKASKTAEEACGGQLQLRSSIAHVYEDATLF